MATAPALPGPNSASDPAPLSQSARIVNTFIAPSKTFIDLNRNASWWAPFLLMVVISTGMVYMAGQKIGFRKIMETQMQSQPKQEARLEQLPPEQRERQLERGAKITQTISFAFPVISLIILMIIAAVLFATFKFAAGADISFKVALAIVIYSNLALAVKTLLAAVSVAAGASGDSFTFQNPVATNPGYFMNPADSPALYSILSSVDIFLIWTLVLTALGFSCVGKLKRSTSFAIVFGWWVVFTLVGAGFTALFA